eukprot:EG_transcript_14485
MAAGGDSRVDTSCWRHQYLSAGRHRKELFTEGAAGGCHLDGVKGGKDGGMARATTWTSSSRGMWSPSISSVDTVKWGARQEGAVIQEVRTSAGCGGCRGRTLSRGRERGRGVSHDLAKGRQGDMGSSSEEGGLGQPAWGSPALHPMA